MEEHGWLEAAPNERAHAWHVAHVRAGWQQVRVDLVEVVRCGAGRRLRAVVRLGDLTPADVRVDVVPGRSASEEHILPWFLWASQSYDNGCYVFEASAPFDVTQHARDFLLRVRPTMDVSVPAVERLIHVDALGGLEAGSDTVADARRPGRREWAAGSVDPSARW